MSNRDKSWDRVPPQNSAFKPRLERKRSELPRGGKDMASQIGAELRAVFAPGPEGCFTSADDVLSQLDGWSRDRWETGR